MPNQRNDPSNTPSNDRNSGTTGSLGGAGAGTSRTFYTKDGYVYDAQSNAQLGRIVDSNFGTGTSKSSSDPLSSNR